MASTNVSCQADRHYVELLSLLARTRRQTVGKMVREALDQAYGTDLARVEEKAAIFFADDSANGFNTAHESSEAEHA